jgi:hypothetical protein
MLTQGQIDRLRLQRRDKFPDLTTEQAAHKVYKEAHELRACNEDGGGDELEEAADVAICLLAYLDVRGIPISAFQNAIDFKIDKTELRTFVRLEDGTYQNVKGASKNVGSQV